jgi:light-regulated signal transduction histidine kinase (bacteriophytochrome)
VGGQRKGKRKIEYYVRDNGAGFDMKYINNFLAFSRDCTALKSLKEQELAFPLCKELSDDMEGVFGVKDPWTEVQLFISPSPKINLNKKRVSIKFKGKKFI